MANPQSVQCAEGLINGFLQAGITNFVVSPGSRNGPIALALAEAANQKLINLAIRLDERSAAFVALGMAKQTRRPAVVVCTSGTAVANLMPALVEAKYSDTPLIAVTADRPKDLINTGVSQTIDQAEIFKSTLSQEITLDTLKDSPIKCKDAVLNLIHQLAANPQPAHLNLYLSEPLVPTEGFSFIKPNEFLPVDNKEIELPADFLTKKGLIIAGDTSEALDSYVNQLAQSLNWPLIAEPPSLASVYRISHHPAILRALPDALSPEVLLIIGRAGLSRPVAKLISQTRQKIYLNSPPALNKIVGQVVTTKLAKLPQSDLDTSWVQSWMALNQKAESAAITRRAIQPDLLQVVTNLFNDAVDNSHIHLSASLAARDFDLMMTQAIAKDMSERKITLSMNRGVNGIDGVVSTAFGMALAEPERQHYCLIGDIATLHDLSGFALPKGEMPVNIHFVIVNNDGGGVFSTLEQAGVENFEKVFDTPHGIEIDKVLANLGVKQVNPGAKYEIKSAPGVSAQVFKVEAKEKIKSTREEIYSLIKDKI